MSLGVNDPSRRLWNEARFNQFYLSGEPETTPNYPLVTYFAKVGATEEDGEFSMYARQDVPNPGEMLIVENTDVSCACNGSGPHTETVSLHAPTTVSSPPLHRLPPETHQHLAHRFAEAIPALEAAGLFSNDHQLQHKPRHKLVEYLDARQHTPIVIPGLNVHAGGSPGSSRTKRGPWNEVEAGAEKILDYESVWNIIANNAMCFKVRSKSREQPSQVETSDLWGMWITPSFMNHSCAPNCHAMRVGNAIIIRAARVIADGEELTLPYFDIYQPLCKRQLAAERWGFRCLCRRCTYESSIGKPYDDIQEEIVNLEKQIQRCSAFVDEFQRHKLTMKLLEKMSDQIPRITNLVAALFESKLNAEQSAEHDHFAEIRSECIWASFSEALIAWYATHALIEWYAVEAYKGPLRRKNVENRTEKAERLSNQIWCVTSILDFLGSVHQGSLFCQEFMSATIKARSDLIYEDIDDEELKGLIAPEKSYITTANEEARSYYGPNVKVFASLNSRNAAKRKITKYRRKE